MSRGTAGRRWVVVAVVVGVLAGLVTAGAEAVSLYVYRTINITSFAEIISPLKGTTVVQLSVFLSGTSKHTVSVRYSTSDGDATAPDDYVATKGRLTFKPGQTQQTINVTINGTNRWENPEYFQVNLSHSVGAFIGNSQAYVYIFTSAAFPTLSVDDAAAVKPASGDGTCTLTVSMPHVSGETTLVSYHTAHGTAKPKVDYVRVQGTLSFKPGIKKRKVNVTILGGAPGPDVFFKLLLSDSQNASISDGKGICTITSA